MRAKRRELHWGRVIDCYAERPANVNDMLDRSIALSPDAIAIVDGDMRISYRELDRLASNLAGNLSSRGVARGERVAVMLGNQAEAIIAVVAISRLGAIVIPVGTRLRRPEIAWIFEDATPIAIIHAAAFAPELPDHGPASNMRFATGSAAWQALLEDAGHAPAPFDTSAHVPARVDVSALDPAGLDASAPGPARVEVTEDDIYGILYTSGTTGRPKGAMLAHLNVVHSCLHWEEAHALVRGERTVLCVPWSHVAGLCGVVLPFLHLGATLVLLADFRASSFLRLARDERITHALMVPAMYGLCLLEPDLASYRLDHWRLGAYGGASMPIPTIERFAREFPKLAMCNAYGATETTSPATIMPPGDGLAHAESIGKVVPCGDIRVMDDQGRELPAGDEGELWIAGPMIVPGYWRNDSATASSFAGGYWKSGDIGAIDADGYVRIADRKKDMINRGGYKVYPAEVESVLTGLPGVVEAAVIGEPDSLLGESVAAFLNVKPGAVAEEQVREWCATRIADYKVPSRIVISSSPLPRNANGKIQKADLRALVKTLPAIERRSARVR
jgi:long-chain acyl-CoA synthetase